MCLRPCANARPVCPLASDTGCLTTARPEQLRVPRLAGRGAGLHGCYNPPVGWDQVAVVVLSVILTALGWALHSTSMRIDDLNRRFDDVHDRIDHLQSDVNARLAQRDEQLTDLRQELQLTRQELKEEVRELRTLLQEARKARIP